LRKEGARVILCLLILNLNNNLRRVEVGSEDLTFDLEMHLMKFRSLMPAVLVALSAIVGHTAYAAPVNPYTENFATMVAATFPPR
jgi:hypothetical protein